MRRLLILATAALLIGGSAFTAGDNSKKKAKAKKENCTKGKHCSKSKSKTASI